ncbi:Retron-type RNA-directed DNA polymerase [Minicystis rosea]|nr:Retron-type RNA-directed DNA polymerase [Minicystis rosea]
MMTTRSDYQRLFDLWRAIGQAGGVNAYVQQQLRERGFVLERKKTDGMSKAELSAYKKSLKEEAAERRRLKKEAWQAYRATHIVHLGEGIFWNDESDLDKWDHPHAAERAAENELPPIDSPQKLAEAMGLSLPDLRFLSFHREAAESIHYRRFTIPKRNGSERAIWAPLPKLKAAQHWILRNVVERLAVHGASHGFLADRSIATNAAAHTGAKIVVKVDLKDFFPTVTLRRVKGIFRRAGYRDQIATLLALICTEAPREIVEHEGKQYYVALGPRCLPQGAPTSPALTNTLCQRLDRRLAGLAKRLGWRYTRYADDLTFSLPESHKDKPKLGVLLGSVGRIANDEGFQVHPDKTNVARKGSRQKVTGLVVNGTGAPRVPRALKRQIRAAIHNAGRGKPLQAGESLSRLAGYAAYIHMTDPKLGAKLLQQLAAIEAK